MSEKISTKVKPGVVFGKDLQEIFRIAKAEKFAIPAVNVVERRIADGTFALWVGRAVFRASKREREDVKAGGFPCAVVSADDGKPILVRFAQESLDGLEVLRREAQHLDWLLRRVGFVFHLFVSFVSCWRKYL